ncbi:MAG TPA: molybdopterin cofactor-binding domain-containing protein [Candidatus Elarobacter sp.]|jgi:xanthine dehydrogenase/oxidase
MDTTGDVVFFLNGRKVTIPKPSPDLLLLDYLRSPAVGLTGAKRGCGQGGCGACTVVLSEWNAAAGEVEHRSINSCLRPVCALNGRAVTTVEGTGSTTTTLSQVAYELAMNNGTQCGYCSAGFVMNMTGFLVARDGRKPTKLEIQGALDGNICRCTGYRPILTGMETYASDYTHADERARTPFVVDPAFDPRCVDDRVEITFPPGARAPVAPLDVRGDGYVWRAATSLSELLAMLAESPPGGATRLVCGNTSIGIYDRWTENPRTLIDVTRVPELHGIEIGADALTAGAATTYTQLIAALDAAIAAQPKTRRRRLQAVRYMARRTAGTIVRNAASLAGNTMLVLKHIHRGEPFPSDAFTALAAVGATLRVAAPGWEQPRDLSVDELVQATLDDPAFPDDKVILSYRIPFGDAADQVVTQKTALREVNSHSIVNSGVRIAVAPDLTVREAVVVFGGIAPYPFRARAAENVLAAGPLSIARLPDLLAAVDADVTAEQDRWRERMRDVLDEGFTEEYRRQLAAAFMYKFVVHVLGDLAPDSVPPADRSAGEMTWEKRPVSGGTQDYPVTPAHAGTPIGASYIKLEAFQQTSGETTYTHEIALPPRSLNGALVLSKRALASFGYHLPGDAEAVCTAADLAAALRDRFPAFVDFVTANDVPTAGSNMSGMAGDQPLLAEGMVFYSGQAIALVLAENEQDAIDIAYFVRDQCIGYGPLRKGDPWYGAEPILGLEQAIEQNAIFPDCPTTAAWNSHIWQITRSGSDLSWVSERKPTDKTLASREATVDGRPCTVVEGTQSAGGQLYFYMETQAAVAIPGGGGALKVHPSAQSPMTIHSAVCKALGIPSHKVTIEVRQLGGAYGGKTEPARFASGIAALAAYKTNRIVRLALPRADDSAMTGKRHPYYGQYQVAIDLGAVDPATKGTIRGWNVNLWGDGGATYDCSFIVSNCIQLRADNAYFVPNSRSQIDVCRTNTASNSAMRAFGDIQGMIVAETALDHAATAIGMTAEDVRERNLYDRGQVTPYGQSLTYCYMRTVWDWAKDKSEFVKRRAGVEEFNRRNRWRKRGITLVPIKYGSGFNLASLEQASAIVAIYEADGTVVVRQSGVESGQGLITKMCQLAALELDVPVELIDVEKPDTSVVPNPTSTGASTGTQYNGMAVRKACSKLRSRLQKFAYELLNDNGPEWCRKKGVDFWNAAGAGGWKVTAKTADPPANKQTYWANIVGQAYNNRVNLICEASAKIAGGTAPVPNLTFKRMQDQPQLPGISVAKVPSAAGEVDEFVGFTYSAACSEVEVDVLTGEVMILRSDIIYDMGFSLNPAVDIGQIEGAFVQGIGYILTEEVTYQTDPSRDDFGRLNSDNTWRYKPPAVTTIPIEMNVHFFPRYDVVPPDPDELFSSKEVGEPPLVLATSVFLAIKNAVRASRVERDLSPIFDLSAPATVQEVRRAAGLHFSAV